MQNLSKSNHKVTAIKSISLWNVRALQLADLIPKYSILVNVENPSNVYQFDGRDFKALASPTKKAFDYSNPSFKSYHALVHDQYGLFFGDHSFTCVSYKGDSYETADDADTYLYDGEKVVIESYLDVAEKMKKDPSFDDRIPLKYLDKVFFVSLTKKQKHNFLIMAANGEAYEAPLTFVEICTILANKLNRAVTLEHMDHLLSIAMTVSKDYLYYMKADELDKQLENRSVDQQQLYLTSYYATLKSRRQLNTTGLGMIDSNGMITPMAGQEMQAYIEFTRQAKYRQEEYEDYLDSERARLMKEFCRISPNNFIATQYELQQHLLGKRKSKKSKKSKKK
jgi:hypothetical protein